MDKTGSGIIPVPEESEIFGYKPESDKPDFFGYSTTYFTKTWLFNIKFFIFNNKNEIFIVKNRKKFKKKILSLSFITLFTYIESSLILLSLKIVYLPHVPIFYFI